MSEQVYNLPEEKLALFDQIVANTLSFCQYYNKLNPTFLISEDSYKHFSNYYNSILKIYFNTYCSETPTIEFFYCSLKFRFQIWKKFKKYAKIKFINRIPHDMSHFVWDPSYIQKNDTKYFNEIWKEYYDIENA